MIATQLHSNNALPHRTPKEGGGRQGTTLNTEGPTKCAQPLERPHFQDVIQFICHCICVFVFWLLVVAAAVAAAIVAAVVAAVVAAAAAVVDDVAVVLCFSLGCLFVYVGCVLCVYVPPRCACCFCCGCCLCFLIFVFVVAPTVVVIVVIAVVVIVLLCSHCFFLSLLLGLL